MLTEEERLNDEVLQRMRDGGDDLTIIRPIKFQVVFSSERQAQSFVAVLRERGLMAEAEETFCAEELPWDVNVTIEMQPELTKISSFEREIAAVACVFGGRNDGWYCEGVGDKRT